MQLEACEFCQIFEVFFEVTFTLFTFINSKLFQVQMMWFQIFYLQLLVGAINNEQHLVCFFL